MNTLRLKNNKNIVKLGRNCCAYEMANRVSFLVDAADYYTALRNTIEKAQKLVFITGWDIKSYTLIREINSPNRAIKLIDMLKAALVVNPQLHIYILCWNWTVLFSHDRELFARLKWHLKGHPRLHFKLDSTHPLGGSHHQKIVVVDDAMAFCGGMDLTDERWDTSDHVQSYQFRRNYHGQHYRPHHDVQVAVDGPIAKVLAGVFRKLWYEATGQSIETTNQLYSTWPEYLQADIEQTKVAVSRTIPRQAYEIVELVTDAITSAKKYIYIENQYFSWLGSVELLERKLLDPKGPEIILVLPKNYTGRLEKIAIGKLTAQIVERLRAVDHYQRLGVFYPKIPDKCDHSFVKVHSKVMIVDGQFLKIGSANFSNRSMSVDTECDLAIEANGDIKIQRSIEQFLFRLIAEHHCCDQDELETKVKAKKSLLAAINSFTQNNHRRLEILQFHQSRLKKARTLVLLAIDPPASWYHMITCRKLSLRRLNSDLPLYIHPAEEIGHSHEILSLNLEKTSSELHS